MLLKHDKQVTSVDDPVSGDTFTADENGLIDVPDDLAAVLLHSPGWSASVDEPVTPDMSAEVANLKGLVEEATAALTAATDGLGRIAETAAAVLGTPVDPTPDGIVAAVEAIAALIPPPPTDAVLDEPPAPDAGTPAEAPVAADGTDAAPDAGSAAETPTGADPGTSEPLASGAVDPGGAPVGGTDPGETPPVTA